MKLIELGQGLWVPLERVEGIKAIKGSDSKVSNLGVRPSVEICAAGLSHIRTFETFEEACDAAQEYSERINREYIKQRKQESA